MYLQTIDDLCSCAVANPRHIAESLGRLWRFGGQHPTASVLSHSLEVRWCCRHLSPQAQRWALWHDAHEILTGDVTRQHKSTDLSAIQHYYDMRLQASLGISLSCGEMLQIIEADNLCGDCEARNWGATVWLWQCQNQCPVDEFLRVHNDLD